MLHLEGEALRDIPRSVLSEEDTSADREEETCGDQGHREAAVRQRALGERAARNARAELARCIQALQSPRETPGQSLGRVGEIFGHESVEDTRRTRIIGARFACGFEHPAFQLGRHFMSRGAAQESDRAILTKTGLARGDDATGELAWNGLSRELAEHGRETRDPPREHVAVAADVQVFDQ